MAVAKGTTNKSGFDGASGTSASCNTPGSSGQLLTLDVSYYDSTTAVASVQNDLAGGTWTLIERNADADDQQAAISSFWKIHAGASERSSYAPTINNGGGYGLVAITAWTGFDPSAPIQASPAKSSANNATMTLGSQTVARDGSASVIAATGYATGAGTPSGYTQSATVGSVNELEVAYRAVNSGATGTVSVPADSGGDILVGLHYIVQAATVSDQTISPSGIATGFAAGTTALSGSGAAPIAPSGAATGEAFGTTLLSSGAVSLGPTGIVSGQAFGTAGLSGSGAASVAPGGIATGQAFGTASLGGTGTRRIQVGFTPARIYVMSNSLGRGNLNGGFTSLNGLVQSNGLTTRFPSASIVNLAINGVTTLDLLEMFDDEVAPTIQPSDVGIVWEGVNGIWVGADGHTPAQECDVFEELCGKFTAAGAHVIVIGCLPQDATVDEQGDIDDLNDLLRANAPGFCTRFLDIDVDLPNFRPPGLPNALFSDEVHLSNTGYAVVTDYVADEIEAMMGAGIPSAQAFGSPALSSLAFVSPSSVASAEAFGVAAVSPSGAAQVAPSGVVSGAGYGTAALTPGPVTLSPSAVPSGESHGAQALSGSGSAPLAPPSVASGEAVPNPALTPGLATIVPSGIATGEGHGNTAVSGTGAASVVPNGVATAESFGSHVVASAGSLVVPTGVASGEQHGSTAVSGSGAASPVGPSGITSAEAFGAALFVPSAVIVSPSGVATGELFGNPTLDVGATELSPVGIASGELVGIASLTPTGSAPIAPPSLGSLEQFGAATLVDLAPRFINPTSVPSSEAFGVCRAFNPAVFTLAQGNRHRDVYQPSRHKRIRL